MNYPYYNPYLPPQNQQGMQNYAFQQNTNMPQVQNQSINWVSGEGGAKSWMISPNSTVLLMDSESPVFYLKSADGSGMPLPLRVFDYKERAQSMPQNTPQATQSAQNNLDDKYVTREEYNALQGKYVEILNRIENLSYSAVTSEDAKRTATNKTRNKGGNADE